TGPRSFKQTRDTHQSRLTGLLPIQQGLAHQAHSIARISASTVPCGHNVDALSGTKRTAGVVWPPDIRLCRSGAGRVVLVSAHPEARQPDPTISHARRACVLPD